MAKKSSKPGARPARPGAIGAAARAGAPAGRPGDRSVEANRKRGLRPTKVEAEPGVERVRVRAKRMVYYDNKRRRVNDVFDLLRPDHFNPVLHDRVQRSTRLRTTTAKQHLAESHDDVLAKKYAASRQAAHTDDAPDDLEDTQGNPLDD